MLQAAPRGAGQGTFPLADAPMPAPSPDLVSALSAASSIVGAASVEGVSVDEIAAGLAAVTKLRSAVDAVEALLIHEADRLGSHCINSEHLLHSLGRSVPAVKRTVRRGRMLGQMPRTSAALVRARSLQSMPTHSSQPPNWSIPPRRTAPNGSWPWPHHPAPNVPDELSANGRGSEARASRPMSATSASADCAP